MEKDQDLWSWSKFFGGFVKGKNFAKATVIGFCQVIILVIILSVVFSAISFLKPKTAPAPSVGSNAGTITNNTEDNRKGTVIQLLESIVKVGK